MRARMAVLALVQACALDTSGLGPGGTPPSTLDCPAGTSDANRDPADGCECVPSSPATELCDGVDNDCDPDTADGADDPAIGVACDGADDDQCPEGRTICAGGRAVCDDPTGNATEECNGTDDDCDGVIDEDAGTRVWLDQDGDGWGAPGEGALMCAPPPSWVPLTGDCDDIRPEIHPAATEVCNLVDDDCDGTADDGAGCGCVGEPHAGHTYFFCNPTAEWTDARDWCGDRAMTLVTVDDAAENAWLRGRMDVHRVGSWWIGLNDRSREGSFEWHGGSPAAYRNWAAGEPNDGDSIIVWEDCTEMYDSGTWNDNECTDRFPWVCERGS